MHTEKSEVKIYGGQIADFELSGFETQISTSITSNLAVMGDFMYAFNEYEKKSNDDPSSTTYNGEDNEGGDGYMVNLGAGFYYPSEKLIFEIYGGSGFGSVTNVYDDGGKSELTFYRPFIQPSIGIKLKNFELGIASRFSFRYYNKVNGKDVDSYTNEDLNYIKNNRFSILFEPVVVIRAGLKNIKIQFEITSSENLSHSKNYQSGGVFSLGISIFLDSEFWNHKNSDWSFFK